MEKIIKLFTVLFYVNLVAAFTTTPRTYHPLLHIHSSTSQLWVKTGNEFADDLIAQAQKIRTEASEMDMSLTLKKIEAIESRLKDEQWVQNHQEEEEILMQQLDELNEKIQSIENGGDPTLKSFEAAIAPEDTVISEEKDSSLTKPDLDDEERIRLERNPIGGWPEKELELYIPIGEIIERTMPDAPFEEKISQFDTFPELEDLRKEKMEELAAPLKQVEEMQALCQKYYASTSSVEKETLQRQIEQLDKETMGKPGHYVVNSFDIRRKPMSEEEFELRYETLRKLPKVLQQQFLYRNNILDDKMDLKKGIMLEHWDDQIQLLDQIRFIDNLPETDFKDAVQGFEALPNELKTELILKINLPSDSTSEQVISALNNDGTVKTVKVLREDDTYGAQVGTMEYVDRSRHVEDLLPSLALLENVCPDSEEIDFFVTEIIDSKTYALRSKPERVVGGYYVRGYNTIQGDDANSKMLDILNDRLSQSQLSGRVQLFFIQDPTTMTDEEADMEMAEETLLFVAGVEPTLMYRKSEFLTKATVSALGALSMLFFVLDTCEMNHVTFSKIKEAFENDNMEQFMQLTSSAVPVGLSLLGTQCVHEASHRFVAWRNKFDIGLPNLVPSLQLGITGAITPLASPPRNFMALFDFAIAGPLAGFAVSLALLVYGLNEMVPMDLVQQIELPVLPINLLRSSALGGNIIEYFLGKGVLGNGSSSVPALPMHPFAISGFLGLIANALALLPLGHTDGGRICLAMFGRRVTWIIKAFATVSLCIAGFIALVKSSSLLLTYTAFATIWQRELEAPVQNEVDYVDNGRVLIGFLMAMLVALTLLPML